MCLPAHKATSVGRMGRDAPVMAISPAQNFLKPPPVPETPMVTRAGLVFWNSSATASVMGNTVEDPSMAMMDSSCLVPASGAACPALSACCSLSRAECLLQAKQPRVSEKRTAQEAVLAGLEVVSVLKN